MKRIIIVDVPEGESIKVSYIRRDGFMYTEYRLEFEEVELPTDEEIEQAARGSLCAQNSIRMFIRGAIWFKYLFQ